MRGIGFAFACQSKARENDRRQHRGVENGDVHLRQPGVCGKSERTALSTKRVLCPLKNDDNIKEVQEALQARDIEVYKKVTHLPPPEVPFELDAEYYYKSSLL